MGYLERKTQKEEREKKRTDRFNKKYPNGYKPNGYKKDNTKRLERQEKRLEKRKRK